VEFRVRWTLFTYMSYFLLSIYITLDMQEMKKVAQGELNFEEKHFKSLFEYKSFDSSRNKLKSFSSIEVDTTNQVYKRKHHYSQSDLVDLYENLRFTRPFMIYRSMKLWPIFDFLAAYCGHLINNLIIVIIAININVSLYMCFNVMCVCYLYMMATIQLNKKSI
jgi:hypothetical protein